MPKNLYSDIYHILKGEIDSNVYPPKTILPGEEDLSERFSVTRNTIRRALKKLQSDGLVYTVKGRGVVVLEPIIDNRVVFSATNSLGFQDLMSYPQNKFIKNLTTKVLEFKEVEINEELSKTTSFTVGDMAYYIERLRMVNGKAMVIDISYFRKDALPELTISNAEDSIYQYIRDEGLFKIAAARSVATVETVTEKESELLELKEANCVGVLKKYVYTDLGNLFECTEMKYVPNHFSLVGFESY
ncbi:GntR family transcriptional regulator [Companilactobacillus nuruki]|uniref:GntR family transcriptional regulator n=1 Tax=Companilactobacillus nuruki TaxID=1993540 RepID=A0A2N7AS42_9LACO|nr:GntR family transcriptional regulator [Companilactobacillus nuruki]PMD68183.1 GntR family transcriptional regulator [Companilactobacillus nuruki]